MSEIDVRVKGQGSVTGDAVIVDTAIDTICSACGGSAEAVAELKSHYVCAECLRLRLEAISVARYQLRGSSKLPWGKLTS